jgi:hypothetical protein
MTPRRRQGRPPKKKPTALLGVNHFVFCPPPISAQFARKTRVQPMRKSR